ncbi:wax ester/triacylglycerol synthase domain-containing protein [Patulibacter minatonensis]|uniref:wax ester/triacylglycerol synthase domain-containing protein n=1 Tax=Patulibacter minatonensis TaxID=298163 RepID=UPI00047EAEEF|nr:wax ester/triacylglycerol synthase domain-containing protein [Patulibacter minatonensis]
MTDRTDTPMDWGSPGFNAIEAVMWKAEADPALSSTIMAVEELDRAPEWERFSAAHDWGSRMVPRFRQRVVDGPLGYPAWVDDRDFDLRHHVFRAEMPDGTWQDVLDRAATVAQTAFEPARPPWEALLLTGLRGGRAAYLLKMHHATLDGAAGVQLFAGLHSRQREHNAGKPQPAPPEPRRPNVLRSAVRRELALVGRGVGLLRGTGRAALHPARTVGYVASLRRVLGPVSATPSPELAERSGTWRFIALDVPLPGLSAAAKQAGASLNDAYLAAVSGAFARYHEALGRPVDELPLSIPISIRRPEETSGGNRFAAARLSAPTGIADPTERMLAIRSVVRAIRKEPAIEALDGLSPALARLPTPVLSRAVRQMTSTSDVQASNIPGIRDAEVFVAGAQVLRLYGFGPLPGVAAMIVLMSHGSTCCVTINHDAAAIAEPETFRRCLVEAFDEILALAPTGSRATLRE